MATYFLIIKVIFYNHITFQPIFDVELRAVFIIYAKWKSDSHVYVSFF